MLCVSPPLKKKNPFSNISPQRIKKMKNGLLTNNPSMKIHFTPLITTQLMMETFTRRQP